MSKKVDKFEHSNDWENWVGLQIIKRSGKPFKSGEKVGIVESVEINPNSDKKAFRMKEDQTLVDCHQCQLLKEVVETSKIK